VSDAQARLRRFADARLRSIGTLAADKVMVSILKSKSGTIIVDGDLIITNQHPKLQHKPSVRATSFLAESVVVGGVPQWRLVHHDDFEASAEGWSLLETSSCNGIDRFLGGHCNMGAGQVTKRFEGLPAHKQVRRAPPPACRVPLASSASRHAGQGCRALPLPRQVGG
jgi:hypothetical protein